MTRRLLRLFVCVAIVPFASVVASAQADVDGPAPKRVEAIQELGKLYGELRSLNDVLLYEMKVVADQENTTGISEVFERKQREYQPRFAKLMELAVAVPETTLALDAAILTLNTTYGSERDNAIDLLIKHHIKSHRMDEAISCLRYTSRSEELCRKVLDANTDPSVRAHARFEIASSIWRSSPDAYLTASHELQDIVNSGEEITFHAGAWGPNQTTKSISLVALQALKTISRNKSLKLGHPIPEFLGESLDGSPVSIADYKGKVTLIVFWATWCGPCLEMTKLEAQLVERYKGLPFDILGICGDHEVTDQVKKVAAEHGMTWTSIHDYLADGTRVSERLGLAAWPYCVLVDRDGIVIHNEFPNGSITNPEFQRNAFQATIEQVLPEFEHKGK